MNRKKTHPLLSAENPSETREKQYLDQHTNFLLSGQQKRDNRDSEMNQLALEMMKNEARKKSQRASLICIPQRPIFSSPVLIRSLFFRGQGADVTN